MGNTFVNGHNNRVMTKETKNKIRKGLKGKHWKGIKFSEQARKNISEAHKGIVPSRENRLKRSISMKGKKQSLNHIQRRVSSRRKSGKYIQSENTKRRISEAKAGKFLGKNHPNWQGGISFLPYAPEFTKRLKRFIKNRDHNECQNPYCEHKTRELLVHHINYDKQNCSQFNLITLCNSCNAKANYNRNEWKHFYKKIVWSKY
jgi:hypothetical protein